MQETRGIISSKTGHVEALHAKRLALKDKIREARKSPATSEETVKKLKLENLRLKDEIERHSKTA